MNHPENPHIEKAIQDYPNLYSRMIADWSQPGTDKVWLMYSANYLFRVGDTRFAVDPMTLPARLGTAIPKTISDDLNPLQLVALTHDHSDHVSWPLLSSIAASVQKWIVPAWMQSEFNQNIPSPVGSIQFVQPGDSIKFGEICIKVFDGNHWETQANPKDSKPFIKGLPSLAYLIEGGGKRWLLPGDTRSFNPTNRITCGKVDLTLAHVFLGRLKHPDEPPPMLTPFCENFAGFNTSRLLLTHLYEVGRDTKEIWTCEHAETIQKSMHQLSPSMQVNTALTGDSIDW